ncbi:MAG: putative ATP-dependent helicase [Prokaryotic dsDNA virus sp.]|nr:MAG: putative ATP-dependent helicase [Prokaryotic dsDNA virus sp.]|tara:strand:- start:652 stop:2412 length:1761 start_codon:yes stop_codon:yes gene_type:complete
MIKEFAFGLNKRHHFHDAEKINDFRNSNTDTFCSLYDYDETVIHYFSKHKTLSGFSGEIYMPDEFILDVDGASIGKAWLKVQKLKTLLGSLDVPNITYFSGTGFHIHIPGTAFRWSPCDNLHTKVKEVLTRYGIYEYADPSVTDKTRIIRIANTRNSKSGLFKVMLEPTHEKDFNESNILSWAKQTHPIKTVNTDCAPVFDIRTNTKPKKEVQKVKIEDQGRSPDPIYYTCIQRMLQGTAIGKRHATALRIAAHLRWRYPERTVRIIMEDWRRQVDRDKYQFTSEEMSKIVDSCYDGHGGNGNRYGCSDQIMDSHCSSTCRLYKSKKSQNTMDATSMEKALINFYASNVEPINLGALYGQDFPVYPGEVVILQAPPASMKTMLLQNWVVSLKKPTLFVEMEMSPRQLFSRFIQIHKGWSEEDLKNHYQVMQKNGIDKEFDYLMVDFSAPFTYELDKRISMLPRVPEVLIIDHMGLMQSKHQDLNMKMEEVSQSLMEVAVKYNLTVFAVSEITKAAFRDGVDIASARGSFRIAYNANKLLSIKPFKGENGLVTHLQLKSDKNREKEQINIKLMLDNLNIKAAFGEES